MLKKMLCGLIVAVLAMGIGDAAWGAPIAFNSAGTGNWGATGTWTDGTTTPGQDAGDSATINATHTVYAKDSGGANITLPTIAGINMNGGGLRTYSAQTVSTPISVISGTANRVRADANLTLSGGLTLSPNTTFVFETGSTITVNTVGITGDATTSLRVERTWDAYGTVDLSIASPNFLGNWTYVNATGGPITLKASANDALGRGTVTMDQSSGRLLIAASQSGAGPAAINATGGNLMTGLTPAQLGESSRYRVQASSATVDWATVLTLNASALFLTQVDWKSPITVTGGLSTIGGFSWSNPAVLSGSITGAAGNTVRLHLNQTTFTVSGDNSNFYGDLEISMGNPDSADRGVIFTTPTAVGHAATLRVLGGALYTNPASTATAVLSGVTGDITIDGATLRLRSTETRPLKIMGTAGLRIDGGTTAMTYTPGTGIFQVYNNAILDKTTILDAGKTLPTLAEIQGTAAQNQVLLGYRAALPVNTYYYGPGDGGNGGGNGKIIWGGIAGIVYNLSIPSGATIKEYTLGGGFTLGAQGLFTTTVQSTASLDATGPINLVGDGTFVINGTPVLNQVGTINKSGLSYLQIVNTGGLPALKTLNVNAGYLDVNAVDALAGTVNLNQSGCFAVDQNLTTGTIDVNAGGGIRYSAAAQYATVVPTFAPGSHLILAAGLTPPATADGNVNYILATSYGAAATFGTFVLSDSTRITSPAGLGGGIQAASGEIQTTGTQGRLAAPTGYTLTVSNKVNFSDKTLIVGDATDFNTFNAAGTAYGPTSQGGTVQLANTTNAIGSIDIQAGTLRVDTLTHLGGATAIKVGSVSGVPATLRLDYTNPVALTGVALSGGGTILVGDNGSGTGTLTMNAGSFGPGSSAGKLTIQGNVNFGVVGTVAPSTLEIEIMGEGNQPGADYDQLYVTGNLTGINNVHLHVGGPAGLNLAGQTFDIVTYGGTLSGVASFFDIVFDPGWSGQIDYTQAHKIVLYSVTSPALGTVPEPAGLGLLGLALLATRRRRS